jgi:uncharacterized paraquat-inducible protein A
MSAAGQDLGPQCPRCNTDLTQDWVHTGAIVCPFCQGAFEATLFDPPRRTQQIVEVMAAGPEGANSCANHARNAAVTSCQRCGLLICALCDMNIGEGSFCPSCFERMRTDGSLRSTAKRYRDYGMIARSTGIIGILGSFILLGIPLGALTIYFSIKGVKQRRREGAPIVGMVVLLLLGALEVIGGLAMAGVMIYAFVKPGKS